MKITEGNISYYPRISDDAKTVYGQDAYAVKVPQGYDRAKLYPVVLVIPGMGDRSPGTLDDLKNLMLGYDYDGAGPLPRQYAIATDDFNKAIDKYGFIGVLVTYGNEFNPGDVDWVMDAVEAEYAIDRTREAIIGFSLGGGAVMREITSSLTAAKRWVLAVACAPVNWATTYKNVVDAKLQLIGTTNRTDPRVDPSNVKNMVAAINALNPAVPADLIIFPQDGHGSFIEMLSLSHPNVPQNIYEYILSVSSTNRLPYPTSTTVPVPPVVVPPSTNLLAVATFTGTGPDIKLSGLKSTGYKWATWEMTKYPTGVSPWANVVKSGGYITSDAVLPVKGDYEFTLVVTDAAGNKSKATVAVNYGGAVAVSPRTIASVDIAAAKVRFSDGTTETLTSITTSVKTYTI